jgi:predicted nucleotide-binding protein
VNPSKSDFDAAADLQAKYEEAAKATGNIPIVKFGPALERARARRAAQTPAHESAAMPALKEPAHITLAEGLILLESHLPTEQAKTRLRQAFIQGVLGEAPRFAFEYDEADIDWVTGSVKIPRKPERFCPSFLRADFNAYFFKDTAATSVPSRSLSRKIFIVHGHEGEPREAVAGFLRKIDFTPVILHEQSNQGRTIVEKFEAHAEVDFAVVLLTPDDVGGPKDSAKQPRPRQNVILELGYFIGKLGREKVCAIKSGEMELPSDIIGVVWTAFDAHGAWKSALARELEAAGHVIDWNKATHP